MELKVEIDLRETCSCLLGSVTYGTLRHPFLRELRDNHIVHVLPDNSVKPDCIRISKYFAESLGIRSNELRTFTQIDALPIRTEGPIIVSPASVDDWEIIESQAQALEAIILSQVKVVSEGMTFPVWTSRGQKPVLMRVKGKLDDGFQILDVDTELAVEARPRDILDFRSDTSRKYLRVRAVNSDRFPTDLPGVGMIVNTQDFVSAFGPDAGCVVTIRDRPDILTIVACDSSLVDPGIVLISPLMRDMYYIASGERLVIEEQARNFNSDLIVPKRLTVGFPKNISEKFRLSLFTDFVEKAGCIILPQGGFLNINTTPYQSPVYVQINFTPIPTGMHVSKVAAVITGKQISQILIVTSTLADEAHKFTGERLPRPFLKYVPENMREDAKKFGMISADFPKNIDPIIPSYSQVVNRMKEYIESSFHSASPSLPFAGSLLLLSQSSRSGRTSCVHAAIASLSPTIPCVRIDCAALSNADAYKLNDVWSCVEGLVRFAFESPPMILFFDDADLLFVDSSGDEEPQREEKRGKILGEKLIDLLRVIKPNRSIFLIGTGTRDSKLLANIFVHKEVLPSKLSPEDRKAICSDIEGKENYSIMELVEISKTGKDNRELRRRMMANQSAEKALLNQSQQLTRLGGLLGQIDMLTDAISLPLRMPLLFQGSKRSLASSGAFVVGPSGTGKSALVDHVVRKLNLPTEVVRGPDLLDKYIGASEQAVRKVFEKAASIAPCVVVFDAIDALCPRRGSESTGVTDRVVNQMLCYLDGVDKVDNVFVVAISSRPDMVDPALIRPGRLDLTVVCDIPNTEEKEDILAALWEDFLPEEIPENGLSVHIHPNCTGADIRAAFVNAKIISSRAGTPITGQLVKKCLKEIKPSISDKDVAMYRAILSKYKGETVPPSTVPIGSRVMLR